MPGALWARVTYSRKTTESLSFGVQLLVLEEPAASWEVALSLLIHVLEAEVPGLGAQCQCGRDERGGLAALCVPAKHRVVRRQVQRKGWLENACG